MTKRFMVAAAILFILPLSPSMVQAKDGISIESKTAIRIESNKSVSATKPKKHFRTPAGIKAFEIGDGVISIDDNGVVRSNFGRGIWAEQKAHGGMGAIVINGGGNIIGTGFICPGGNGDNTKAFANGMIGCSGIRATILNPKDDENVTVTHANDITATSAGINGFTQGNGNVRINSSGQITAYEFGVEAQAKGTGNVSVNNSANIATSGTGILADNEATKIAGKRSQISLVNSGDVISQGNSFTELNVHKNPYGILAGLSAGYIGGKKAKRNHKVRGTTTITNSGTVTATDGDGIFAYDVGKGKIAINNSGTVSGSNAAIQIRTNRVASTINQWGTLNGNIVLTGNDNTLTINNSGALNSKIIVQGSNNTLILPFGQSVTTTTSDGTPAPLPISVTPANGFVAAVEGGTPNQKAVAYSLDHLDMNSDSGKLLINLISRPLSSIPAALDLIAPEEYGTAFEISRSAARMTATAVENRLDQVHASPPVAPGANGPAGPTDGKGSREFLTEYRLGVFANGSGEFVSVGNSSDSAGYNFDSGGATFGVDYKFTDHFVAGVLFNYTRTRADLTEAGRLDVDAFRGGAYASLFGGGAYVNAYLGGGYNDYEMRRAGLDSTVRGETDGAEFNALVTTGYDVHAGNFTFGPVASFQYLYTGLSSLDESGSLAPLRINSGKGDSLRTNIGGRATYDWHIGKYILTPEVRATYQHEYGETSEKTTASFQSGSPNFTVTDSPIGRDSLALNAGFSITISPHLTAYAFYDGELARSNYQANNVLVGIRASF